ncbi:MAG: ATP-dependent RNA helicase RhlB, partial [Pseudomonadota bacterium]
MEPTESQSTNDLPEETAEAAPPAAVPAVYSAMSTVRFRDFKLPEELLKAYDDLGFEFCTPIQAQSIPITLA